MNIGDISTVKISDNRKIEIKKLMTMIETYNADLAYKANADYYGDDGDYGGQMAAPPAKQQLIDEFNRLINDIKQAKEHKNNLDF